MSNFVLEELTSSTQGFEILEEKFSPTSEWKNLKIKGVFQRADAQNHNGRVYPFDVLTRALNEAKTSLDSKNMFGELDHPADGSPTVSLKNVSHIITNLQFYGKDMIGEAVVFDDPGPAGTPTGRLLGALIRNGCTVGISSRGLGAVDKSFSKGDVVQEYKLITFDCVHDPSTHNAYVKAVTESRKPLMSIQQALEERREMEKFAEFVKTCFRR